MTQAGLLLELFGRLPDRTDWEYQERANWDLEVMRKEFRERLYLELRNESLTLSGQFQVIF